MAGLIDVVDADVLVIGGGGAALRAAIAAHEAGARVRVVVKSALRGGGSTASGQSEIMGFAAALGQADPRDGPEWHFRDTVTAGDGLVDPALVRVLAEEAPARLHDLESWGVGFLRDASGRLVQSQSDFATYPRVCRVEGGRTGPVILEALAREVRSRNIPVDEGRMAARLVVRDGRVAGVVGVGISDGRIVAYRSRAVVLAAGGMGAAFRHSVGDDRMTGDSYALAYEVGAELVNMEITQVAPGLIHPTWAFLSRPVYQVRPRLLNGAGEEFLSRYLPPGVTADQVYAQKVAPYTTTNASRYVDEAIEAEVRAGRVGPHGGIFYDLTHVPESVLQAKLPNTLAHLRRIGVDPARDRLEVAILFHLINGGVRMVDGTCRSTVPGLYVAGEAAGGVRGPNRPGGNSLAEGQVFGRRAGLHAALDALSGEVPPVAESIFRQAAGELTAGRPVARAELEHHRRALQELMTGDCLVTKDRAGLSRLLAGLTDLAGEAARVTPRAAGDLAYALGTRHAIAASMLVARAALAREETRGSHFRRDFPETDDARWRCSIVIRRGESGPELSTLSYPAP